MINKHVSFKEIKISDAKKILVWRKKKKISKYQYTDISSSLNLQKKWIKDSYNKKNYYHWLIKYKKKPIGFICINDLDLKKKETDWAYYIGSDNHVFLGALLPPFFYNWAFKKFRINKINSFVFSDNTNIIKIHKYHGYKLIKKFIITKNDKKINCVKMVLKKKDWNFDKFSNYISKFPTVKRKQLNFK
jgi:RimJ/RimL family protein N-acetyltransferase